MATPVDKCHAEYRKCIGSHPTPLQQAQCTFRYAQCILGTAQTMLARELRAEKKPKKPRTRGSKR